MYVGQSSLLAFLRLGELEANLVVEEIALRAFWSVTASRVLE
jgi:hypothetical protein